MECDIPDVFENPDQTVIRIKYRDGEQLLPAFNLASSSVFDDPDIWNFFFYGFECWTAVARLFPIVIHLVISCQGDRQNCIELLIRQKNVGCCTYNKPYTEALKEVRREEGLLKAKRT